MPELIGNGDAKAIFDLTYCFFSNLGLQFAHLFGLWRPRSVSGGYSGNSRHKTRTNGSRIGTVSGFSAGQSVRMGPGGIGRYSDNALWLGPHLLVIQIAAAICIAVTMADRTAAVPG